jgi:hypothetical protein
MMFLQKQFSDQELSQIIEEGAIYMCACPAQVAVQLRTLRALLLYQSACEVDPGNDARVHRAIAEATLRAHEVMETCMVDVLALEGWDRTTLKMPEGLRRRRDEVIARDA